MPRENKDGQEKSEKPSGKRQRDARSDGNVAKSQELNSFAVIFGGLATLTIWGGWMMDRMMGLTKGIYGDLSLFQIDAYNFNGFMTAASVWLLITLAPILIVVAIMAIVINYLQFGFLWSKKALKPKWGKMNPFSDGMKGFKKLVNKKAIMQLGVNIIKLLIIGYTAYTVVRRAWPQFVPLMDSNVGAIFLFLIHTILEVAIWTLSLLFVLAIIDFIWQKWNHHQDLKMTKTEVKEERKMMDGDPKIKRKIREMGMQFAFNKMIKELPEADVVVTNPVHVAVALKYDPETMKAPVLVGKGLRLLAERIKEVAREHDIPILENPPLARALYKSCEIGEEIPGQFYQDVAEIIAYIYELRDEEVPA